MTPKLPKRGEARGEGARDEVMRVMRLCLVIGVVFSGLFMAFAASRIGHTPDYGKPRRELVLTNHIPPLPWQTNSTVSVTRVSVAAPAAVASNPPLHPPGYVAFVFTTSSNNTMEPISNSIEWTTNDKDWHVLAWIPANGSNAVVFIKVDYNLVEKHFRMGTNSINGQSY